RRQKDEVLQEQLAKYKRIFEASEARLHVLSDAFREYVANQHTLALPNRGNGNGRRVAFAANVNGGDDDDDGGGNGGGRRGGRGRGGTSQARRGQRGGGTARGAANRSNNNPPWANGPVQNGQNDDGPKCLCGTVSRVFTVKKEGPNKGRTFRCCPKGQDDPARCKFFEWMT
ncbi:DNA topoisomerase III, partial [Aphelenchoides avenae]